MTIRTNRTRASVLVLAVAIAIGAFLAAGTTATAKDTALPRNGTLYTSGTAWGPFTNFNPLRSGYATGVLGLLYETLFRYDPLKDKFIPWLATSGRWAGTTYVLNVRPGVTWNDGKPLTAADVKYTFETGKLEGSEISTMWKTGLQRDHDGGQHRPLRLQGDAGLPGLGLPDVLGAHRPAPHLVGLQRDRDHDRQRGRGLEDGRHGAVQVRGRQGLVPDPPVGPPERLVGDEGPRDEDADGAHRRHPQHAEHRVAAELPAGQDRPLEQLLPRRRQGDRREGRHVLQEGAVHAGREHGLARPEHDEEAARRPGLPAGARHVDQHRPDRQGRLREHRLARRTRPASCPRGASGSTRRRPSGSASPTARHGRSSSSRRPATATRTATGSSRTRTGPGSTCGSSSRTAGRTG